MGSSKSIAELAGAVDGHVTGDPETVVDDVTHDSRQAGPGVLFVAVSGEHHDGHDYVDEAKESGVAAVCVSRPVPTDIPAIVVGDTRAALGRLAAEVHDNPSASVGVIGVTGTNGKTTVTHYVESLLERSGFGVGLIGTIATRIGGIGLPSERTTPEASDLQRLLARMRDAGVDRVAMEVSSHALELMRVDGTRFDVAAFTNLSQDHLDFHGSMDAYRGAKARLFTDFDLGAAVFNIDDPVGADLARAHRGELLTVGAGGDFEVSSVVPGRRETGFTLDTLDGTFELTAPVIGDFNLSNLAVALACSVATGVAMADLAPLVGDLSPVPGRFQIVSEEGDPTVVVDYAHTPAGISTAVATGRASATGRVIVVFGAGGDRDRAKRPLMGRAAAAADVVVVTSDNPRSEDPDAIIDQVASGIESGYHREPDRRKAIFRAVFLARPGDVVLILGKGHEKVQESGGVAFPFDDASVASEALALLRMSTNLGPDSGSMAP